MALTNRKKKDRPVVESPVSESRFSESVNSEITPKKEKLVTEKSTTKHYSKVETDVTSIDFNTEYSAKDRKTIKADPDIKSLIEIFRTLKGDKAYETLRNMAKFYYVNNYDERAQRIIASIQNNKFLG
ncbi:hypothetical protein [Marinilactibacillus psychrotolerans]|uniref:Uncharacterized protein n=1 Tax=Marinilactibacillus psychrotolerans TaxID=191770 RepID=A0AAV3WTG6_9LACT|nr:hypothetical protein [Marinilactibacillus psychrotolerans]GEL67927.1 hypothetical protein MPS01_20820 [Marinilactibacillus psychrotolerans]GEQ35368.1 hypothetical protein M132T_08760 [Marinilactibacillus psychrotolerans]SDD26305.1 hypothetical protein SAMN04488013_12310 [Marinilactibacillus psychrotolerans]